MQRDLIRGLMMAAIAALALGACDKTKVPLPGERVSVLQLNRDLVVDPTLADTPVKLPKPYVNDSWAQVGGNQAHAMYHLASGQGALARAWSADVGSGADFVVGEAEHWLEVAGRTRRRDLRTAWNQRWRRLLPSGMK